MSRAIKVSDEAYQEIYMMRGPGETIIQAVDRLLDLRRMLLGIEPILSGSHAYHEWKKARENEKATAKR